MRRILYILGLVAGLALCGCSRWGKETTLSPAEYYDLGRYARLDGDWSVAVGYFEQALSAAERTGNDFYRGYACQQLAALWVMAEEDSAALLYSMTAVAALNACGEEMGAFISRLEIVRRYQSSGNEDKALKLLTDLRVSYPDADLYMKTLDSPLVNEGY